MDIKNLLEKMQQFAGEPEQKAGDQVRGTDVAKKSGKGKKHPFLHQLVGDSKKNEYKNKLIKEFQEFKEAKEEFVLYIDGKPASKYTDHNSASRDIEYIRTKFPNKTVELKQEVCNLKTLPEGKLPDSFTLESNDQFVGQWVQSTVDGWSGEVVRTEGEDLVVSDGHELRVYHPTEVEVKKVNEDGAPNTVSLDIPLMIRLFEYAREDAKSDMDLHFVAEKMIELSEKGRTLSMDDYSAIVGQATEAIDPPSSQGTTTDPAKPGQPVQKTPDELNKERQEQQNLTKSLSQLKAAGIDINPNQAQKAFTKADTGVTLNPTDKETVSKLAPAVGDIIANPTLAGQFKSLVQKAQQQAAIEKK